MELSVNGRVVMLAACLLLLLLSSLVSSCPHHRPALSKRNTELASNEIRNPHLKRILIRLEDIGSTAERSRTLWKRSSFADVSDHLKIAARSIASKLYVMRERPDWNGPG